MNTPKDHVGFLVSGTVSVPISQLRQVSILWCKNDECQRKKKKKRKPGHDRGQVFPRLRAHLRYQFDCKHTSS